MAPSYAVIAPAPTAIKPAAGPANLPAVAATLPALPAILLNALTSLTASFVNLPLASRALAGLALSLSLPLSFLPFLSGPSPNPNLSNAALAAIFANASVAAAAAAASASAAIVPASNPFNKGLYEAINLSNATFASISVSVNLFLAICAGSVAAAPPASVLPSANPAVLFCESCNAAFSSRLPILPYACAVSVPPKPSALPTLSPPYTTAEPALRSICSRFFFISSRFSADIASTSSLVFASAIFFFCAAGSNPIVARPAVLWSNVPVRAARAICNPCSLPNE